jgi:hypothetical protein
MKHFQATVQCPKCSHVFSVCVHGVGQLDRRKTIVVVCPMNRRKFNVPGSQFSEVEKCAEGALVIREFPRR